MITSRLGFKKKKSHLLTGFWRVQTFVEKFWQNFQIKVVCICPLLFSVTSSHTPIDEISISQNESLPLPTPQLYSEETVKWLFICATMQSEGQFLQTSVVPTPPLSSRIFSIIPYPFPFTVSFPTHLSFFELDHYPKPPCDHSWPGFSSDVVDMILKFKV